MWLSIVLAVLVAVTLLFLGRGFLAWLAGTAIWLVGWRLDGIHSPLAFQIVLGLLIVLALAIVSLYTSISGVVKAECRFTVTVSCKRRAVLSLVPKAPGSPNTVELLLDFDPGSTVEVSDTIGGPWAAVPNATPGMKVTVDRVNVRFYRIR